MTAKKLHSNRPSANLLRRYWISFWKIPQILLLTLSLLESALMARYAVQQLGGQRIAFIALNNDAGLQFMENATKAIEDLKAAGTACETVATETFNEGEVRDYSAMVLKIKDANPDVIVVNMGYVECAAILNQARQAGLTDVKWLAMSDANPSSFTGMMIGVLATIIITIVLVQVRCV